MESAYDKTTIESFLHELSSKAPTPGGGSVAALSGSIAASLVLMVVNLTLGKERFEAQEPVLKEIMNESELIRDQLRHLIDADMTAYQRVIAAYRSPKTTEEEKEKRKDLIRKALKYATDVPLETAQSCLEVLELSQRLCPIGNPNAVTDIGVAARIGEAALQSALYNVDINCNSMKDSEEVDRYREKRRDIAEKGSSLKREIASAVEAALSQGH